MSIADTHDFAAGGYILNMIQQEQLNCLVLYVISEIAITIQFYVAEISKTYYKAFKCISCSLPGIIFQAQEQHFQQYVEWLALIFYRKSCDKHEYHFNYKIPNLLYKHEGTVIGCS